MAKTLAIFLVLAASLAVASAKHWFPVQGGYDCKGSITALACETDANGVLAGVSFYNDAESEWTSYCGSTTELHPTTPPGKQYTLDVGDVITSVEACRGGHYGYTSLTFTTDSGKTITCGNGPYDASPKNHDYGNIAKEYLSYDWAAEGSYDDDGGKHGGKHGRHLSSADEDGDADVDKYYKKGHGWGWKSKCQVYKSPKQPSWSPTKYKGDGSTLKKSYGNANDAAPGDYTYGGGKHGGDKDGHYGSYDSGDYSGSGGKHGGKHGSGGDYSVSGDYSASSGKHGSKGGKHGSGGDYGVSGDYGASGDYSNNWGYTENKYSHSKHYKSYSSYYKHSGKDGKKTHYYKDYATYKQDYSDYSSDPSKYDYTPGYYYKQVYPLSHFKACCDKNGYIYNVYSWCWNHGYVPPTPTDALPVSVEIVFSQIGRPCPTEAQFAAALANLTTSLQAVIPCLGSIRYGNFQCQGPIVGTAQNTTVFATLYMVPKADTNCTCLDILSQLNATGLLGENVCTVAGPQCSALGISSLIFKPLAHGTKALQKLLLTRAFRTAFKASKLLTKFV